jgi:hypothetical protein
MPETSHMRTMLRAGREIKGIKTTPADRCSASIARLEAILIPHLIGAHYARPAGMRRPMNAWLAAGARSRSGHSVLDMPQMA